MLCALETVLKHWKSSVSARSHTGKPQISLLVNDQNREHWWGGRWRGDLTTEIVANEIKSDLKSVSVLETAQKHCEHRPVLEVPPGSLRSGFMIHRAHHHQPHPTTTTIRVNISLKYNIYD